MKTRLLNQLFAVFIVSFLSLSVHSQTFDYSKSTFNASGDTGTMITPNLVVKNVSSSNAQIFITRVQKNLPLNWTVCFCYIICQPPTLDTLRIDLIPGELVSIGNGFYTKAIPDLGSVRLRLEEVGGSQIDTLTFTGSTLATSIPKLSNPTAFDCYPNPANKTIRVRASIKSQYTLQILSSDLKLISEFNSVNSEFVDLPISTLASGTYFLKLISESGNFSSKKIIIQH